MRKCTQANRRIFVRRVGFQASFRPNFKRPYTPGKIHREICKVVNASAQAQSQIRESILPFELDVTKSGDKNEL